MSKFNCHTRYVKHVPRIKKNPYKKNSSTSIGLSWNGLYSDLKLSTNANNFKHKIKDACFTRLRKEEEDSPYI